MRLARRALRVRGAGPTSAADWPTYAARSLCAARSIRPPARFSALPLRTAYLETLQPIQFY